MSACFAVPAARPHLPARAFALAATHLPRRAVAVAAGFGLPYLGGRVIGPWSDPVLPLLLGTVMLASVAAGRPFIAILAARRAATPGTPSGDLTSMRDPGVLRHLTVVWGAALLTVAAVLTALVAGHATHLATLNLLISNAVPVLLGVGTIGWMRRRRPAAHPDN